MSLPTFEETEGMRIALAQAGPITNAVLYNNGVALADAIEAATSVLVEETDTSEFNTSLMLMGG